MMNSWWVCVRFVVECVISCDDFTMVLMTILMMINMGWMVLKALRVLMVLMVKMVLIVFSYRSAHNQWGPLQPELAGPDARHSAQQQHALKKSHRHVRGTWKRPALPRRQRCGQRTTQPCTATSKHGPLRCTARLSRGPCGCTVLRCLLRSRAPPRRPREDAPQEGSRAQAAARRASARQMAQGTWLKERSSKRRNQSTQAHGFRAAAVLGL